MKGSFRQSMAWLHTWCGLVAGWLLCAIFLTGTLSVFREPLTQWMAAKPALPARTGTASDGTLALDRAVRHLHAEAADARFWRIELPARDGDAVELFWPARGHAMHAAIDPATGALLPAPWGRKTEGGRHFMSFHYTLHGGIAGYWLVGWLSMCMLVALVSGVVVHRRIFQDFFTFRPGKGQRSWLDAHNVSAVLALPFLLMIVYTGVAFFPTSYMPWPLQAAYGSHDKPHARFQSELAHAPPLPARPRTGIAAPMHALAPLLQAAQSATGRPARMLVVEQPGDRAMRVRVFVRSDGDAPSRTILNPAGIATFDGVTGELLHVQQPVPPDGFSSAQLHGVMESLHVVHFGGWPVKWLYFLCGLMGTAMMATGTLLFSVKRRQKSAAEFGPATAAVYRAVEALNVSAIAGICIACIAYLYGNRLLPADMAGREAWELRLFMCAWGATLVHALARTASRAWIEQLSAAAVLCLALPLLNGATTGQHLGTYAATGDWQRAGVETVAIAFGAVLAMAAWRLRHKAAGARASGRLQPARRGMRA